MIEAGCARFHLGLVHRRGGAGRHISGDRRQAQCCDHESLKSPEVGGTLVKLSVDAKSVSPEEFAAFLTREREKWTTVVKGAGVQVE